MALSPELEARIKDFLRGKNMKHVCANCYHYHIEQGKGGCWCRDVVDIVREANHCTDWTQQCR